ncbi:ribose-phosphate diphosphokinase [Dethiobacter alkaliphilus]|uniref:Ribose-phosphate pyrophosphokinase n=1 Tax=Dethiobacter alkaliphilus AHT 1 TaxID=555088 RepID=C0GJC9_DETAL|nr:ribose-phosphate pyrophosphokinase [Dethiobacter alkaliphilus]EEG76614.1 ribose-phosphate pyrophosphokinase [Dethiobacter alkaliphilus AHT 1]MCW3489122.1 ribose-phosphate pyrophosphokinase [Dethiobacter alkaliphilus]
MYRGRKLQIFSGTANMQLTEAIAEHVGVPMGQAEVKRFSDGELSIYLGESVRGADVFIVQPTSCPANENLMELLIMMDALKRASAKSVNSVLPYYGYARQDRKTRARDPITAKLVADLITTAGADRVITMDLHAGQIQGFFNIPVDHLKSLPILAKYFQEKEFENAVVVSPDMGGVTRARELAERLQLPIAIIDKRRPEPNVAEVMNIIGKVKGKTALMIDDIIDTAGTISLGASALLEQGAKEVYACCTHPILSGPALERLDAAPIKEIVVTNTIPVADKKLDKLQVLSVAPLIGDAIIRIHEELSVSKLFD